MKKDDLARLKHMLDAAKEALSFISEKSENDLYKNRMLALSLIKDLEIIGEAANKVSEETRKIGSKIQWQDIVDMRNHLIHGYFDIDLNLVWNTVNKDIPPLITELQTE
tara:strand:- start:195 stop:521 length:327 start_codon:yes stop_codon:yes gene_type:complete